MHILLSSPARSAWKKGNSQLDTSCLPVQAPLQWDIFYEAIHVVKTYISGFQTVPKASQKASE